jgi:hypothetical protein
VRKPFLALLLCAMFCSSAWPQSTSNDASPNSAGSANTSKAENKRKFAFSPMMGVAADTGPLTAGDKFKLFALNTVNPFQIVASAAAAGLDQAQNTYAGYGQGAEGYGKRFGAAYAGNATAEFFGTFLFSSILKTDPRYFRRESGGFTSRTSYAISRIFVSRTDSGGRAPNLSLWMGALASGGIANTYYPKADQGVGLTFTRAGIALGTTAGFNILKEFWPDIEHKVFHTRRD